MTNNKVDTGMESMCVALLQTIIDDSCLFLLKEYSFLCPKFGAYHFLIINYSHLPEDFLNDVNKLMEDGEEILLGNSDFDYCVYCHFRNEQYGKVSVIRDSPVVRKRRGFARIEFMLNSCLCMLKKCDRMIAVWVGESPEVYSNKWSITSLKYGRLYKDAEVTHYCPPISPLYRLRLSKSDWNQWPHGASGEISVEEVLKTLDKVARIKV